MLCVTGAGIGSTRVLDSGDVLSVSGIELGHRKVSVRKTWEQEVNSWIPFNHDQQEK